MPVVYKDNSCNVQNKVIEDNCISGRKGDQTMKNRARVLLFSSVASLALLLFFAVPSYSQDMENMMQNMKEKAKEKMETTQQAPKDVAAQIAAARAGNGFTCTGTDTTWGCSCKQGEPVDNPATCRGMAKFCKSFDHKMECKDGYCNCGGAYLQ
jgi:Tfp pilus assembly protein PilV